MKEKNWQGIFAYVDPAGVEHEFPLIRSFEDHRPVFVRADAQARRDVGDGNRLCRKS